MQKEIFELERDVSELEQCRDVLTTELTEEQAYQEQMRNMIA